MGDLFAVIGLFLLSNLLIGFLVGIAFGGRIDGLMTFFSYTASFAVTIAFALMLTRQRTGSLRRVMHFSFQGLNPTLILWGVILMLAMNVVIEPLIELFPKEWYEWIESQISSEGWAALTAVLMAPVCEEILFRGIIQDSLTVKRGPISGILIASAIFGAIHGIPQQVVAGFFLGLIIGYLYWRTRSLWSAIILHGINNALATFMNLFDSEEALAGRSLSEIIGDPIRYRLLYAGCAVLL
ncbi:MAG: CPBP family intramembrane metalloprotease, partial [Rikenellaceae bacterium]|nr:CPBP family intramembrane metalloprotease [Rikenellaceae bacterium]